MAPHLGQHDQVQHPLWLNGEYFKVRPTCTHHLLSRFCWFGVTSVQYLKQHDQVLT